MYYNTLKCVSKISRNNDNHQLHDKQTETVLPGVAYLISVWINWFKR